VLRVGMPRHFVFAAISAFTGYSQQESLLRARHRKPGLRYRCLN
jgi:hypothetical protein